MSIAELIRQDVLDLHPEPPHPPCPIPPRLLILACSATKATGERLRARDRYQGPLWQTLRAADPVGSKAFVCFPTCRAPCLVEPRTAIYDEQPPFRFERRPPKAAAA